MCNTTEAFVGLLKIQIFIMGCNQSISLANIFQIIVVQGYYEPYLNMLEVTDVVIVQTIAMNACNNIFVHENIRQFEVMN